MTEPSVADHPHAWQVNRGRSKERMENILCYKTSAMTAKGLPADWAQGECFAYVQNFDTKSTRCLFELLKSQGLQANRQRTFPLRWRR